ncbi:MAG: thioredoxin family protein, partial [Pseudomonadota bacterium]
PPAPRMYPLLPRTLLVWPYSRSCAALEAARSDSIHNLRISSKVNTEAEPYLGTQFGIRSIPTLVLFQSGREVARHSGAIGAQDIVRWVSAQLRNL